MFVRLEKIDPELRQMRFYAMSITQSLFGEWCLIREWGRIGSTGGQQLVDYSGSREEVEAALHRLYKIKCRRGYSRR